MPANRQTSAFKCFDFIRRADSVSRSEFDKALETLGRGLVADPESRALVTGRVHNLVSAGDAGAFAPPADYDAVLETWTEGPEQVQRLQESDLLKSLNIVVNKQRSFSVVAHEVPIYDPSRTPIGETT